MFNATYICIEDIFDAHLKEFEFSINENIYLLHLIDLQQKEYILDLINFYYNNSPQHNFSICLKNVSPSNAEILLQVAVLIAHPLFKRNADRLQIFVLDNEKSAKALIEKSFKSQGYKLYDIIELGYTEILQPNFYSIIKSENKEISCTSKSDFENFYHSYLKKNYQCNGLLIIKDQISNAILTASLIKSVIDKFCKEDLYLCHLIRQIHILETKNQYLSAIAAIREKDLKTLHNLFEENAKNNEIDFILKFYHKEYEVLPLWYKRIGHIIKALSGKRSWRSLVHKNE